MRPQQVPDLVQQHRTRHRHRPRTSPHQQRRIEIKPPLRIHRERAQPRCSNRLRCEQRPHEIRHLFGRNQPCQAKRPQLIRRERPNPAHAAASIRPAAVNIGANRRADAGTVAFAGRAFASVRARRARHVRCAPPPQPRSADPTHCARPPPCRAPPPHAVTPDSTAHTRSERDCQSNAESGFSTTATGSGRSALRRHSKNSTPAPSPINPNTAVLIAALSSSRKCGNTAANIDHVRRDGHAPPVCAADDGNASNASGLRCTKPVIELRTNATRCSSVPPHARQAAHPTPSTYRPTTHPQTG